MTIEMQMALERELTDAQNLQDPTRRHEAIEMVQSHMLAALIDCQRKTSDRVKEIVAVIEEKKNKLAGAKMLWVALRYLAAAGGGGVIARALVNG